MIRIHRIPLTPLIALALGLVLLTIAAAPTLADGPTESATNRAALKCTFPPCSAHLAEPPSQYNLAASVSQTILNRATGTH